MVLLRIRPLILVIAFGCTKPPAEQTVAVENVGGGATSGGVAAGGGDLPAPNSEMPANSVGTDIMLAIGTPQTALIDGRADIFSASQARANADRGGVLPTRVTLPLGSRSLDVSASGQVGCGTGEPTAGPSGGGCAGGSTDIESADGISGISHSGRTQFLVGVFLAGGPPSVAPPRLDVSAGQPGEAQSRTPALGQTFLVGESTTITIPSAATTLYLGFADAWGFHGAPSYYADNTGGFRATITAR